MEPKKEDVKDSKSEESKAADKLKEESKSVESKSNHSELDELEAQIAQDDKDAAELDAKEAAEKEKASAKAKDDAEVLKEKSDKNDEVNEDDVLKDILGEEPAKEPDPAKPSEQTDTQKLAELQRKNEKLYNRVMDLMETKKSNSDDGPPTATEEQISEMLEKDFPNVSANQTRDIIKITQGVYRDIILPTWEKTNEEKVKVLQHRKDIEKHKYYKYVKGDIDELAKNDPEIKDLPESLKWKAAVTKSFMTKLPQLIKAKQIKADNHNKENSRILAPDTPADKIKEKKANTGIDNMTKVEQNLQKHLGLSDKDLETYNEDRTVIEE